MSDINSVTIIGRLTRDAELKYTAQNQPVSKFSIAVNRSKKNGDKWEEEASFFDVNFWGLRAESMSKQLIKGKQVCISGELRQDRWQQDGQNRSRVYITAIDIQLFGGGQKQEPDPYAMEPGW